MKKLRERVESKAKDELRLAEEGWAKELQVLKDKWSKEVELKVGQAADTTQQAIQAMQANTKKATSSEPSSELLETWINECKSEVFEDSILQYKLELTPATRADLKKTISHLADIKLMKSDQEKVFHEVGEELNLNFELFKREADFFYRKQIQMYEETLKEGLAERVKENSKQKVEVMEKEVLIKYLQKLEKQKQDLKKTFEEKDLNEGKVREI